MKKFNFKSVIAVALTTIMTLSNVFTPMENAKAASYSYGYNVEMTSSLGTIKNLKIPTKIKNGDVCSISGTVTPNGELIRKVAGTYDYKIGIAVYNTDVHKRFNSSDNTRATAGYQNRISYASAESVKLQTLNSYNLSSLDSLIEFNRLEPGEYMYTIYLSSAVGNSSGIRELYTCSFVVYSSTNSFFESNSYYHTQFIVSDWKVPFSLRRGKSYSLNADINVLYKRYNSSNLNYPDKDSDPKYIRGQIIDSNGNIKCDSGKISLSGKCYFGQNSHIYSVPLPREVDNAMVFNRLDSGSYIYKLTVYYNLGYSGFETTTSSTTPFSILLI